MSKELNIENLRALVKGFDLNAYQKALAIGEFNQLESKLKEAKEQNKELKIDWEFIEWINKGMWSKHESASDGIVTVPLWYNTYRYSVMKKPLTNEELYQEYLNQQDNE